METYRAAGGEQGGLGDWWECPEACKKWGAPVEGEDTYSDGWKLWCKWASNIDFLDPQFLPLLSIGKACLLTDFPVHLNFRSGIETAEHLPASPKMLYVEELSMTSYIFGAPPSLTFLIVLIRHRSIRIFSASRSDSFRFSSITSYKISTLSFKIYEATHTAGK